MKSLIGRSFGWASCGGSRLLPVASMGLGGAVAACVGFGLTALAQTPAGHVEQVIIAFKTHFDIGYTDLASNVVQRYRTTMIEQALQVSDQNRDLPLVQQFVWTIPGWPLKKILEDWPGQTPERKTRVLRALRAGRFAVHALPFTTHTELLELEDLVRGLGFAANLSRSVGIPLPREAKMTDVPCHSWVLPTLLKHAGVEFLHLGCNAASRSPQVPPLFWWEGPDGSRLLTMYSAAGYGTGLAPPKDWPYKTWLALIHTGDNHGPPNPKEVKQLLQEAAEKLPHVKVRIGRLADFADALLAEKPNLPVIRGDMPDTWIHGPMSDPAGAQLARTVRPEIGLVEALGTELVGWGVKTPSIQSAVAGAYESSLLYGEHTWGGALYWITSYAKDRQFHYGETWRLERAQGRFDRLESSWAEHTAYIQAAYNSIRPLMVEELQVLAQAVNLAGPRWVVYNPLPWKRSGLVRVKGGSSSITAVKPCDGPDIRPATVNGEFLEFIAQDVPAMGYRTYLPVQTSPVDAGSAGGAALKWDAQERVPTGPSAGAGLSGAMAAATLENEFFKIVLDAERGGIRSWIDKRSGRELAGRGPFGLGQYLYERFDADQVAAFVRDYVKIKTDWAINELGKPDLPPAAQAPYRAASPSGFKVRLERSPVKVQAVMESAARAELPHAVSTKVTLYPSQPYLDLEITLHNKAADPWPEAGWICLPLNVTAPQFRLGRLGALVDPAKDIVPGANHHLFAVNTGVSVADHQGFGIGLCPLDDPLVSLDVPGCWKYEPAFTPRRPIVFINLFNNQWTTNFRLWNQGTWTARVRLWVLEPAADNLITGSWEARQPLQAAYATGNGGHLPPAQRGLELSRRGVLVTAFGPNPDGAGTVLRLWEQAGGSGTCEVRLPAGVAAHTVQPVNLRGEPEGEPIRLQGSSFGVPLRPFAPASYLLRP